MQSIHSGRQAGGPPGIGALVGALETVGLVVVGEGVGLGDMVGSGFASGRIETSAQLKNCSGQVVERVPSLG